MSHTVDFAPAMPPFLRVQPPSRVNEHLHARVEPLRIAVEWLPPAAGLLALPRVAVHAVLGQLVLLHPPTHGNQMLPRLARSLHFLPPLTSRAFRLALVAGIALERG